MNPAAEILAARMTEIRDALEELEMTFVNPFWEQFAAAFLAATPPSQRRRWQRDTARANRRPSLIHNGRKARK